MNSVRIRVRFYETDMAGIVHHSNYIRWFELGRVEYLRANDFDLKKLIDLGYMTPILSVQCDYKTAISFDDELILETRLLKITRTRATFGFRLLKEADGKLVATGKTQNTFSDIKTGHAKPLPKEVYQYLVQFEEPQEEA